MNTEEFIKKHCHNAPHLRGEIAELVELDRIVRVVEYDAAVPGWECDLHGWLVETDDGHTFVVETNHGGAFIGTITDAKHRLERHRDSYNNAIALLDQELQQKAHVTT